MTIRIQKIVLFWILIFFNSCGPATFEDLRFEGEAETRLLAKELRAIVTKEDLAAAIPRLRKRFNRLADLLIAVQKYPCPEDEGSQSSEELFLELARIYEMAGGREAIELAQSQAVQRLKSQWHAP